MQHVPAIGEIPADVGERAVDELSFLNLSFKVTFGRHLLLFTEPRTIAAFLLGCETAEDYTTRVASVADVLNKIDVGEVMAFEGKRVEGSLNALQAILKREGLLLDEAPLRVLRRIVDIRNSFPIHSGNQKFLTASSELGITYPPESWETAWNQVRYHLWISLKALRLMLSVPATPQGTDPAGT